MVKKKTDKTRKTKDKNTEKDPDDINPIDIEIDLEPNDDIEIKIPIDVIEEIGLNPADLDIDVQIIDTDPTKKKRKSKKQSVHYVNAKEMKEEIVEYYKTKHCTHQLGTMINKIAEGLSFAPNFINYSYKEEMVGDAKLKMFSALLGKKFNVDSEYNPFAYFTTIAFNAFINRIKKEKRQHDTITRYKEKVYEELINPEDSDSPNIYTRPNSVDDDDDGCVHFESYTE